MKAYKVEYKKTARARTVLTLVRFAESLDAAIESAKQALEDEYYGDAKLLSVSETADPR